MFSSLTVAAGPEIKMYWFDLRTWMFDIDQSIDRCVSRSQRLWLVFPSLCQSGAWFLFIDQQMASQTVQESPAVNHTSLPPSLPNESSSIGHDSVRVIFILSYVMNEGEDELHSRLDQHHISCRGRRGNKVREEANKDRREGGEEDEKWGEEAGH